jgi:hypothetical protein
LPEISNCRVEFGLVRIVVIFLFIINKNRIDGPYRFGSDWTAIDLFGEKI